MPNSLADRLARAFDSSKHTKAELARAAKVAPASVSDWFSGETKSLKAEPMVRAAAYLGVQPLWLVTGEGPMRSGDQAHTQAPAIHAAEVIPMSKWDLPMIDAARWASCSEAERGFLQGVISAALTDLESRRSATGKGLAAKTRAKS